MSTTTILLFLLVFVGGRLKLSSGECINQQGEYCDQYKVPILKISEIDNNKLITDKYTYLPCHPSCSGCSGPSSANCTDCKQGYERDIKTNQCLDIDECDRDIAKSLSTDKTRKLCKDGTYCLNTEGHYKCAQCHPACWTCLDYGRDKCIKCNANHRMDEERNCIDYDDEDHQYQYKSGTRADVKSHLLEVIKEILNIIAIRALISFTLYQLVSGMIDPFDLVGPNTRTVMIVFALAYLNVIVYPPPV